MAGLCDSLLVVEAKEKSGSLITANIALEENRNVLVVPGRVDAELSRGCNLLFREGAKPVLDSSDILEEFAHDLTK
nr:DNA-processing protein DprA [uncultured Ligilactobacillus sp.]